jgi:hypothetical protein
VIILNEIFNKGNSDNISKKDTMPAQNGFTKVGDTLYVAYPYKDKAIDPKANQIRIFKSKDGGNSWTKSDFPDSSYFPPLTPINIIFPPYQFKFKASNIEPVILGNNGYAHLIFYNLNKHYFLNISKTGLYYTNNEHIDYEPPLPIKVPPLEITIHPMDYNGTNWVNVKKIGKKASHMAATTDNNKMYVFFVECLQDGSSKLKYSSGSKLNGVSTIDRIDKKYDVNYMSVKTDSSGDVHLFYYQLYSKNQNNAINYSKIIKRSKSNNWEEEIIFDELQFVDVYTTCYHGLDIDIDKNNNIHMIWKVNDKKIYYATNQTGSWESEIAYISDKKIKEIKLSTDLPNIYMVFRNKKDKLKYLHKNNDGWVLKPTDIKDLKDYRIYHLSMNKNEGELLLEPKDEVGLYYDTFTIDIPNIIRKTPNISLIEPAQGEVIEPEEPLRFKAEINKNDTTIEEIQFVQFGIGGAVDILKNPLKYEDGKHFYEHIRDKRLISTIGDRYYGVKVKYKAGDMTKTMITKPRKAVIVAPDDNEPPEINISSQPSQNYYFKDKEELPLELSIEFSINEPNNGLYFSTVSADGSSIGSFFSTDTDENGQPIEPPFEVSKEFNKGSHKIKIHAEDSWAAFNEKNIGFTIFELPNIEGVQLPELKTLLQNKDNLDSSQRSRLAYVLNNRDKLLEEYLAQQAQQESESSGTSE